MLFSLPKKVLQMYSEIWFPDFDSEKWLSSLLSIRLNWKAREEKGKLVCKISETNFSRLKVPIFLEKSHNILDSKTVECLVMESTKVYHIQRERTPVKERDCIRKRCLLDRPVGWIFLITDAHTVCISSESQGQRPTKK